MRDKDLGRCIDKDQYIRVAGVKRDFPVAVHYLSRSGMFRVKVEEDNWVSEEWPTRAQALTEAQAHLRTVCSVGKPMKWRHVLIVDIEGAYHWYEVEDRKCEFGFSYKHRIIGENEARGRSYYYVSAPHPKIGDPAERDPLVVWPFPALPRPGVSEVIIFPARIDENERALPYSMEAEQALERIIETIRGARDRFIEFMGKKDAGKLLSEAVAKGRLLMDGTPKTPSGKGLS